MMRTIIAVLTTLFTFSAFAQGPAQREPAKLWVLDGLGGVHTLSDPEIVIGLPGDVTMEMVLIPAGSFMMGSTDDSSWSWCYPCEQPVHEVTISNDFYMGETEVTQAQWLAVMGSWPGTAPDWNHGVGDDYPAYYVNWNDCQNFITTLNQLGQGTFRLPSEVEWEYACRAGSTTRFCFGDSICDPTGCTSCDLDSYAWWCGNNTPYGTKPVGGKLPNAFGLYDMHGNVWEWCQDWYDSSYHGTSPSVDPTGPATGTYRVFRGGCWGGNAQACRSAFRSRLNPDNRYSYLGVRVVRTP